MKTYKGNLREYLRVIEMCEKYNKEHGTDVKPWECVKFEGSIFFERHPDFVADPDNYTFAISILEAKPVFVGNKVFLKGLKTFITVANADYINDVNCSWNRLERGTVIINGVWLPRPLKQPSTREHRFTYKGADGDFYFNDYQEFRKWENYFTTLLLEARDKED